MQLASLVASLPDATAGYLRASFLDLVTVQMGFPKPMCCPGLGRRRPQHASVECVRLLLANCTKDFKASPAFGMLRAEG